MFTGIVEDVGQVAQLEPLPSEQALKLTVRSWRRGEIDAVVGPETIVRTTLGHLGAGASVNLERPLRLGDRLGGHMVAGHVDAVGRIAQVAPRAEAVDVTVRAPGELLRYVIEKGSIAVDGISLTVNAVDEETFTVSLIPHTQTATTLLHKGLGGGVNLEVDLVGKYVEKLVGGYRK
jgi:riboflavin synthase